MQTPVRHRRAHNPIISESLGDMYPHDLNLYKVPPCSQINLNEFEDIALERLQLLRILEQASLKGHKPYTDEWKDCIKQDLLKAGLKKYVRLMSGYNADTDLDHQARRVDHISHFILRLAYCRSEELRRWFLSREMEWFKLRFVMQTNESIKKFLEINNLTYIPISSEEKDEVKSYLIASTSGMSHVSIEVSEYYKVPFVDVCPLVKNRRCYLRGGLAYIPTSDLVVCIQSKFRAQLSEALNFYFHRLPYLDDDRINPLLTDLHNVYTGNNYNSTRTQKDGVVDPAQLDAYAKKHFPLCMRHIHSVLRSEHHLKHGCRLQYGLFLKAIGLMYEDAVKFFREEFTKKMDSNKFDKSYLYNIKHQYGMAGSMTNWSPFSCMKIIMGSLGPGEHHGCPYKHWDPAILKAKLLEYGIGDDAVEEISELAKNGHFQIACGKYFEVTHGKAPNSGINHPNQYYEESMELEKSTKEAKK